MAMIRRLDGLEMKLDPLSRIAENATLVGNVVLAEGANIWYGAVLRGDFGGIAVGRDCAVEDNCVLHGEVTLGEKSIVGHGAILHHCKIGSHVLIGMGTVVLSGAVIGDGSVIAAGAVVTEGAQIPAGSMVMGVPGKIRGPVSAGHVEEINESAACYRRLAEAQLPSACEERRSDAK